MMKLFTRATNDLFRLRELYIGNGNENLRLSNEMARNYQTAIITVVLAELAFLGTLGLQNEVNLLIAIGATILIISLAFFLIGIGIQQMAVQHEAKTSFDLAAKVDNYIKTNKEKYKDNIPEELKNNQQRDWASSKLGNIFLLISYLLILLASGVVLVIIWCMALS